jgi:hypothetical protein
MNGGFRDASETGFGSSIQTASRLSYRIDVRHEDEGDETSNYYQEFTNVVEALEEEGKTGDLADC